MKLAKTKEAPQSIVRWTPAWNSRLCLDECGPLVLLRVGAVTDASAGPLARVGIDKLPLDGFSEANREVSLILGECRFG